MIEYIICLEGGVPCGAVGRGVGRQSAAAWGRCGKVCYGVSMVIFFYLLSNYRLSQVVPFLAMTGIFNMAVAAIFLHESISMVQIVEEIIVANQG